MTTFLDKLKKGMGETEEIPQKKPELEEILQEEPSEEKPIKKESIEKESKEEKSTKEKILKKKRIKKEKTIKKEEEKKEKIEFKKIEVKEEPAFVFRTSAGKEENNWLEPKGQLTVDVYQTDKEFIVQSAIAGIQTKDLDISVDNDMLIIRGVREKPFEEEGRIYSYQECFWGPFSREIVLPEEVDCSRIQASIMEGILTIRVPKVERRAQRKIPVE